MLDSDLNTLWNSSANQPPPAITAAAAGEFLQRLRTRRRGFIMIMSLAGFWLSAVLIRLAWLALHGRAPAWRQEWGAALLLLVPLGTLIFLMIQFRRHCHGHAGAGKSIQASLRALLDENRLARQRLKIIAALHLAVMLLMPVAVLQLRAAGKAGAEITVPAFVLLPLLQSAILLAMLRHHRHRLQPRRRELESLLADYQ